MAERLRTVALAAAALSLLAPILTAPAIGQTSDAPFGFIVRVSLSPKAEKKLTASAEKVIVRSFYYGKSAKKPTRAEIRRAEADGQEPGQIEISSDEVTVSASGGLAVMAGRSVGAADAAAFGPNPVNVNVNVFSARLAFADNVLDCDLFDDAVALARSKTVAITCRLIGET